MPFVKINDINLYYEIHVKEKPLVIIWGMVGEISSFVDYLKNNLKNYQLIIFDNRGTGRSDKPDEPHSFEMMAEDTIGLMNKIGIESAHLLGISMGSRIALVMAEKYPEKVKSLMMNVAAARSPHEDDNQAANAYERLYDAMTQPKFLKAMGEYPPSAESFIRQFDALKNFDGRDLLDDIMVPTLIVNGTKDPSTPVKFAEELSEGIFGSKLILVEEDHLFIRNNPDLLINPIIEFLEEIDFKSD